MESGCPETLCPSLRPEMCCPINVARGLFSCSADKVVDTVVESGGGGSEAWIPAVIAQSLPTRLHSERQEQQASELPLHGEMISSVVMLLRAPPPPSFFIYQDALYNTAGSLTHCQSNYSDHL